MDKPQEQIPMRGTSYRYMRYPFKRQPLQLLYPGRPMSYLDSFDYSNIPNEDPEGLKKTKEKDRALSYAYQREIEAMERMLGGKGKMAIHPAVDPTAILEQVGDGGGDTATASDIKWDYGPGADMEHVSSSLDNLNETEGEDSLLVTDARNAYGGRRRTTIEPAGPEYGSIPANYDWEDIPSPNSPVYEYFEDTRGVVGAASKESYSASTSSSQSSSSYSSSLKAKGITWLRVIVLIAVILCFVMLVMWGVSTGDDTR